MASSNVNYHLQICIEPSCSNPVYAKNLCRTHYQRRAKQQKVHDEVIPEQKPWTYENPKGEAELMTEHENDFLGYK